MAATHTYVVNPALAVGDTCYMTGTVDTIPSTGPIPFSITMSYSAIQQATLISYAALEALIAPNMLAAAVANGLPNPNPPVPVVQLPGGTFTL